MKAGWDINEIYAVAESPNALLIKPSVFPALGDALRNCCPFSSHGPALGQAVKGDRAFHGETRENNPGAFVQGTGWGRACTCTSGAGRDVPVQGAHGILQGKPWHSTAKMGPVVQLCAGAQRAARV